MAYLLHQLLTETAQRYPDSEALAFGERTLTYNDLERETNKFASLLPDLGVVRGARVGIHLRRGIESVIAAIGILKAGAAYVPLDPTSPAGRLRFVVNACHLRVVVTAREGLVALSQAFDGEWPLTHIVLMDGADGVQSSTALPSVVDWTETPNGFGREAPQVPTIDTDTAYVLFTSGSTGTPKGVVISHLNALTFINTAQDFFAIGKDDRLSHICSLHTDMSVFDIYVAMKAGACVVGIPETAAMFPVKLAEVIAKGRISVWNSVPSALSLLATLSNLDGHDLSSLRLVLFAGEVFPLKSLRRLQAATPAARYCNMYGQTEANSSTYHWVGHVPDGSTDPLPIGRPLPNFDVFALDTNGKRVTEAGREGELYVRASTVAAGYWNEPEKTAEAFVANPLAPGTHDRVYKTGDMVRLDPNGEYVFLGRHDLMIKSRGYRIEIGEIETVLRNHPGIRNAVVIPIPDERIGNRLSAIIELAVAGGLTKDDIGTYCVAELPRYMVPDEIAFRDSLPLTSSGKVDRLRLSGP